MKTHLLLPVCLFLTVGSLQASPLWTSNRDDEYLLSSDKDLSWLSLGVNMERNNRELTFTHEGTGKEISQIFQFHRFNGYLGCDVLPWLTVYGTGGGCRMAVGENMELKEFEDGNTEYGGGFRVNLLDHIILDPLVVEDRIRLTYTFQYTRSSFEIANLIPKHVFNWFERRSVLQLSIVNDIPGNPWFHPESLALNIGIVYSDIEGDHELDQVDAGWMTLGIEMFYSKRISLDGCMYFSNDNETRGMSAGLHIRL